MPNLIDAAKCREWNACYEDKKLDGLFDRPLSLREVLTRTDGPWADVSKKDRIWVAARAMSEADARRFGCDCADRALAREVAAGRTVDQRSLDAIAVSRRFADGLATKEELSAAWSAAESAARSAAESAARSAAESAAWSAARSAAWYAAESAAGCAAGSAAESAAWYAAWSAAWYAAESAEREWQVNHLLAIFVE